MAVFTIKKWRKKAISMFGKARGLTEAQRNKVTKSVKGKTNKPKKAKSTRTKKRRTMAKKKKSRRRGFSLQTVFKWLRIGSFIAPALPYYNERAGPMSNKVGRTLLAYGGIDSADKFNVDVLKRMWTPFVLTNLITFGIGKMNGLIRGLK